MSVTPENPSPQSDENQPSTDLNQSHRDTNAKQDTPIEGPEVNPEPKEEESSPLISIEFDSDREQFERGVHELEERHLKNRPYGIPPLDELAETESEFQKPDNILTRILEKYFEVRFERPPKGQRFIDQERFIRQAKPYILPAKSDHPPLLYFGGINSTGYNWKQIATILHLKNGAQSEVYSLKGHEGKWKNFLHISYQDWVEDIIDKAEKARQETGKLPIIFGQSTGALALALAIEQYAERTNGGKLCAGAVFSGPPISIKRRSHRISLSILDKLQRKDPESELWKHISAKTDHRRALIDKDPDELRNMSTTYIPVKALLELWRLIPPGGEAFKKVSVPSLVIQGKAEDHLVAWKSVRGAYRKMKAEDKQGEFWDDATHSPMFGDSKFRFWATTTKWLEERRELFDQISLDESRREIASLIQNRIETLMGSVGMDGELDTKPSNEDFDDPDERKKAS